jgi:hypothetical protein
MNKVMYLPNKWMVFWSKRGRRKDGIQKGWERKKREKAILMLSANIFKK